MKLKRLILLFVFLLFASVFVSISAAVAARHGLRGAKFPLGTGRIEHRKMEIDGKQREFYLYFPKNAPASASPLVIALHGGGGTARNMDRLSRLSLLSDKEGFLLVFPQGLAKHWADGRTESGEADIKFISTMIAKLNEEGLVNQSQVFATGISNGGFFSQYLAKKIPSQIAAVASIAATLPDTYLKLEQTMAVPVLYVLGTKDPLIPYSGGRIGGKILRGNRGNVVSAEEAIRFWRRNNGIDSAYGRSTVIDDGSTDGMKITSNEFTSGDPRRDVTVYTIDGGGHTWPQGWQYLPAFIVGDTSKRLNCNEVIWQFFKTHAKSENITAK